MRNKKSNKNIKYVIELLKKIAKNTIGDSVIFFTIIIGYYDFDFKHCFIIGLYIIYKITFNKSNFYNKVAFS